MKRMLLSLAFLLAVLGSWSQEPVYNDRDTVNSIPEIGIMGDVVSGYTTTVIPYEGSSTRYYWYHADPHQNPVRQIVVLRKKWPNVPEDILAGDGGYMLAAVTAKEYAELKAKDLIWGECWQVRYPEGIYKYNKDTVPNVPGYEIICYELGNELYPEYGPEQRAATRELMSYKDTINGKEQSFLTVAANITTASADYTPEKTNGKYSTRWMMCDEKESSYWMEKWKKHQYELISNKISKSL